MTGALDVLDLEKMSRDEKSLLLYLESRAVDHGGMVDTRMMNEQDMETAKVFAERGVLTFCRVPSSFLGEIQRLSGTCTHFVVLTPAAWNTVALLRRERAGRRGPLAAEVLDDLKERGKVSG